MNTKQDIIRTFESKTKWTEYQKGDYVLFNYDIKPKNHQLFLNIGGFKSETVEIKFFVYEETFNNKDFKQALEELKSLFNGRLKFPNQKATKDGYKLIALKKYESSADALAPKILEVYKEVWEEFTNKLIELLLK